MRICFVYHSASFAQYRFSAEIITNLPDNMDVYNIITYSCFAVALNVGRLSYESSVRMESFRQNVNDIWSLRMFWTTFLFYFNDGWNFWKCLNTQHKYLMEYITIVFGSQWGAFPAIYTTARRSIRNSVWILSANISFSTTVMRLTAVNNNIIGGNSAYQWYSSGYSWVSLMEFGFRCLEIVFCVSLLPLSIIMFFINIIMGFWVQLQCQIYMPVIWHKNW